MKIVRYKCDLCGHTITAPIKMFPEKVDDNGNFITAPDDTELMLIREKDFCISCVKKALAVLAPSPAEDLDSLFDVEE